MYCGTEFFSIYTEDYMENDWYRKEVYTDRVDFYWVTRYEFAKFTRQKYGAHLKFGIKLIAFKKVDFDFFVGLGAAYRMITYSEVIKPVDEEYNAFDEWFSDRNTNEGESVLLHMALGIKVGIILWEK